MLTVLGRRPAPRPRVLTERGQGFAVLLGALAFIFWMIAKANAVS